MSYLLDTNTVRYFMEKRPAIVGKVREAGGLSSLSVAAVTVAELRFGVERMPEGRKKRKNSAELYAALDSMEILPFSEDAAAACGWAAALLEKEGVAWGWPDLAIASVALAEHLTLASNDGVF